MTTEPTDNLPEPPAEPVTPDPPPELDPSVETDPDGQPEAPPEDEEEGEYNGVKAKYPKAWKGAFMLQADATRKTMEAADIRKAYEARDKALQENAAAIRQDIQEHGHLFAIDQRLAEYQKVDWDALFRENPDDYRRHRDILADLKSSRADVIRHIQGKHAERSREAAEQAKQSAEESRRTIAKDIPSWSPKVEQDLTTFAGTFGFTADEIKEAMDTNPRAVKVLHLAYLGHRLQQQARKAAEPPPPPPAEPAKRVSGNGRSASSPLPSDKDDIDTWMKKEHARMDRNARQ